MVKVIKMFFRSYGPWRALLILLCAGAVVYAELRFDRIAREGGTEGLVVDKSLGRSATGEAT